MEPMSILHIAGIAASSAKGAWDLGQALYGFCSDVANVDQSVAGFAAEIKALSAACSLVNDRLREIVQDHDEGRTAGESKCKLWICLQSQVLDCQDTIKQLHQAIQNVQKDGFNVFAQMWRQIKLNMKTKDIAEARNRIRSHTTGLQMVLQTIAIEVFYLAPQKADQQLRTLLGLVGECMEQLKVLRAERTNPLPDRQHHEVEILELGRQTVSNGESLYASSITNGSLMGDPAFADRAAKVHEWVNDINAIDRNGSDPASKTQRTSTASTADRSAVFTEEQGSSTAATDHRDFVDEQLSISDQDIDSEDEFLVEAAKEALDAGRTSFKASQFVEADLYLQEALKMIRELPSTRQKICDTWELRYSLSVCAYHIHQPTEAEAHLLNVIDIASRSTLRTNEQRQQVCEAGHLLSIVCIKLGKLEQARLYCENALKGRHRLLGKAHQDSLRSLALMARILQLQNNDARSKVYVRMIPDAERNAILKPFEDLNLPPADCGIDHTNAKTSLPQADREQAPARKSQDGEANEYAKPRTVSIYSQQAERRDVAADNLEQWPSQEPALHPMQSDIATSNDPAEHTVVSMAQHERSKPIVRLGSDQAHESLQANRVVGESPGGPSSRITDLQQRNLALSPALQLDIPTEKRAANDPKSPSRTQQRQPTFVQETRNVTRGAHHEPITSTRPIKVVADKTSTDPEEGPAPASVGPTALRKSTPTSRSHTYVIGTCEIAIRNIPSKLRKEQLLDLIRDLKLIEPQKLHYRLPDGANSARAIAQFADADQACTALNALHHLELEGQILSVRYRSKPPASEATAPREAELLCPDRALAVRSRPASKHGAKDLEVEQEAALQPPSAAAKRISARVQAIDQQFGSWLNPFATTQDFQPEVAMHGDADNPIARSSSPASTNISNNFTDTWAGYQKADLSSLETRLRELTENLDQVKKRVLEVQALGHLLTPNTIVQFDTAEQSVDVAKAEATSGYRSLAMHAYDRANLCLRALQKEYSLDQGGDVDNSSLTLELVPSSHSGDSRASSRESKGQKPVPAPGRPSLSRYFRKSYTGGQGTSVVFDLLFRRTDKSRITATLIDTVSKSHAKVCRPFVAAVQQKRYNIGSLRLVKMPSASDIEVLWDGLQDRLLFTSPPVRIRDQKGNLLGYVTDGLDVIERILATRAETAVVEDGMISEDIAYVQTCRLL